MTGMTSFITPSFKGWFTELFLETVRKTPEISQAFSNIGRSLSLKETLTAPQKTSHFLKRYRTFQDRPESKKHF